MGERLPFTAPAEQAEASRLLASFKLSPTLATQLTEQLLPRLQCDDASAAKAVLVVGPRDSGKTHLLAAICSLAENAELAASTGESDTLISLPAAGPALAGRFQVFRPKLVPATAQLRDLLILQLEKFLGDQGISFVFSLSPEAWTDQSPFVAMMELFQQELPDRGLLVAIDALDEFLAAKQGRELTADLEFLHALGAASQRSKLRVIATARRSPLEPAPVGVDAVLIQHLRLVWATVPIGAEQLAFVLHHHIVRKTAEQRVLVERHLTRFAGHYDRMQERMADFVAAFPLHPDCFSTVSQGALVNSSSVLRLFAETIARKLDEEMPETEPGVIAYDAFWPQLAAATAGRDQPEHKAVVEFVRGWEARVEQCVTAPANRAMARRLIQALGMRRLAVGDLYGPSGCTAAELRDGLCLFRPGLEPADETDESSPAERLQREVKRTLEELRQGAGEKILTLKRDGESYDLHFKKFRRFNRPELFLHWANALPFLLLLLTGGAMLGSRFFQLDRELLTNTVLAHKICALTWFLALPLSVLTRIRPHLANIRTLCTWGAEDVAWMVQSVRALYNKSAHIPPADRFNTGQKINSCLVVVYYFGFVATGSLMFAKGTILFPWYIHTALFFSALGSVGGHLFLAFINPSTRIALGGIFHGWAPMKYIEHHHSLSLPESLRARAHSVSLRTIAVDLCISRIEIAALVGTLFLGATGAYAFSQARLATAKQQFAKSFADVIQPSQLNTKHRIGPTADSCTKCHLYQGQIPDRNCEECHADVKARRAGHLGYHGTLEGECRTCHREHREATVPFVPLDQATFDHNKAMFKLAGKHTAVKCDDCHKRERPAGSTGIYYLGLKYAQCTDCHADRHAGQFKAQCETCHSTAGWTGQNLKFHHESDSNFKLTGLHTKVECRQCHLPAKSSEPLGVGKFKGLAQDCAGCHQDPHRQQFANRCKDCHTTEGWDLKHVNFTHNKDSKFKLLGKHEQVECAKCHRPAMAGDHLARAQFRDLGTACADCHQSPHRNQFSADCTTCHASPATWKVTSPKFVHDRDTKFTLLGKHAAVECQKCHQPLQPGGTLGTGKFKGLETTCASCHTIKHPEWYGTMCTSCHTPENWVGKEPVFDHALHTKFELVGKHLVTRCSECHREGVFGAVNHVKPFDRACFSCHEKTEPHKKSLGTDCQKCHTAVGWKGEDLIFDHNTMASFGLNADHVNLACSKCHEKDKWKPLDPACTACHPKMIGGKPVK